jgi:hypothetical protein
MAAGLRQCRASVGGAAPNCLERANCTGHGRCVASTAGSDICVCDLGWRGDNCSNMSSHFHERCPVRESCLFLSVLLQPHEDNERPLTACERQAGFYGECGQCKEACDMFTTCSGHGRCRGKTACDCGENAYVIFVLILVYSVPFYGYCLSDGSCISHAIPLVRDYHSKGMVPCIQWRCRMAVSTGGMEWQYDIQLRLRRAVSHGHIEGKCSKDSIAWAGSFVYRYAVFSSLSLVLGRAGVVQQKLEARGGGGNQIHRQSYGCGR